MGDMIAILLVLGTVAAGIAALCLVPGGAALVAGVLNSRVGQAFVAVGAAVLAVLTIRKRAFSEGEASANRLTQEANAEAAERQRQVERDVAGETEDALRAKLRGYPR